MVPAIIKSRDAGSGQLLHSASGCDEDGDGYPDHPLPMVLYVHGGPWGRDYWEWTHSPVASEPGLRRFERQLPQLDRFWKELRQCRKPGVGQEDA